MLRYGVDVCGADKLLFGSDMPVCSAGMYVYGVLSENLTEDELSLVLAGNCKRLLGMK
jgi:predicted TIM-barrel fold metal-dependent hydrolase